MEEPRARRGREQKWTQDLRTIMFARIVMEFGPYDQWGMTDYPQGKKARYEAVLQELADYFSLVTGRVFEATAVRQQINFGRTRQEGVFDQARARSFILNKAAALQTGFIHSRELPELLTAPRLAE